MQISPAGVVFGVSYYPDHWPESDWARDLDLIKETGIGAVRFGEFSWSWFEPREGQFDFSAYDRFVALAQERDLRLTLCTPTATPPPWFLRKFPDCRLVDSEGKPCTNHRHYWCWNHRASRAQAEATIRALVAHFKGHPAIASWQIENEPNYADYGNNYDYNPATMADYRAWLRQRYNDSLDALNHAWFTNFWSQRYGDWEEIGVLVPLKSNPNTWLDFTRFREHNVSENIHWQAGLIRAEDPAARVGTNIPESGVRGSLHIAQDYWAQAQGLDWVGTCLYINSGDRAADVASMAFSTDLMRSVAGPAEFLIAETCGGPTQRSWEGFPQFAVDSQHIADSIRTYGKHGAKQIWMFLFRAAPAGFEAGMNPLTDNDGRASERTEMIKQLSANSAELEKASRHYDKRPLAVMHYSRDSIRFLSYWDRPLSKIEASLKGWHKLLIDAGYRVEFVNDDGLLAGVSVDAKLLVLPQSHLMSDRLIEAVLEFAKRKNVITHLGPHTAMLDENGHLRQSQYGGALVAAAGAKPGFWVETKSAVTIKLDGKVELPAFRQATVDPEAKVSLRLKSGDKWPAIIGDAIRWYAFEPGAIYTGLTPKRRGQLRKLVLAELKKSKLAKKKVKSRGK